MMLSPLSGLSPAARTLARTIAASVVAAFAAWSWLGHGGLSSPTFDVDTFDYAQMSRQLHRGEGFTMQQSFPYVLRWLGEHEISTTPPWPNTTRFPLIAVEEATAFRFTGANDRGILLAGGALFAATAAAVFLLGSRLFGPLAGLLAAIAVAFEPMQLHYSRSGLLETGAGLFITLMALALVAATDDELVDADVRKLPSMEDEERAERRRHRAAVALGFVLGAGFLQRYDLLAIAPVAVALLLAQKNEDSPRGLLAAWCAAGFAAAAGPWIVRNIAEIGTVLGSTSIDRNLLGGVMPGDVYLGTHSVSAWGYFLDHWRDFAVKFDAARVWFGANYPTLFGSAPAMVAALFAFLVAPLTGLRSVRIAWMFALGALVARAVLLSLMHNEARFYLSFTPVLLTLGIGSAMVLLRRLPLGPLLVPLIAILAIGVATWSVPRSTAAPISGEPPALYATVAASVAEGTIVASDQSWLVAWYADRPSIRFGGRWQELKDLEAIGVLPGAILLGRRTARDFLAADGKLVDQAFTRVPGIPDDVVLWLRKNRDPLP